MRVGWSDTFADRFEGTPLKHVALSVAAGGPVRGRRDGDPGRDRGRARSTRSAPRSATPSRRTGGACSRSTCGPTLTVDQLAERLQRRRPKDSASNWLRRAARPGPGRRSRCCGRRGADRCRPTRPAMAALVKAVPVVVVATMPIERAISTAGGIAWSEVDESLMLRRLPGHVRRGRDARLGGAHRRLPAAGVVQHRGRRGAGRAGVARALSASAALVADAGRRERHRSTSGRSAARRLAHGGRPARPGSARLAARARRAAGAGAVRRPRLGHVETPLAQDRDGADPGRCRTPRSWRAARWRTGVRRRGPPASRTSGPRGRARSRRNGSKP